MNYIFNFYSIGKENEKEFLDFVSLLGTRFTVFNSMDYEGEMESLEKRNQIILHKTVIEAIGTDDMRIANYLLFNNDKEKEEWVNKLKVELNKAEKEITVESIPF